MSRVTGNDRRVWLWTSLAGGLVLAALFAPRPGSSLQADVTALPARPQFQAGGERSEIVLKEILAVLQRMDARLEKIERSMSNLSAAESGAERSTNVSRKGKSRP